MSKTSESARQVLQSLFCGVLSTHSLAHPGYPFGSLVPYCLDETGSPLILISGLAQHTKNIEANDKVSLTLLEQAKGDVQQSERLTLLADAIALDAYEIEQAAQRYYAHFPQSIGYHDQLDFRFYRLKATHSRYIEGFGKAHWVGPDSVLVANPFSLEQEHGMVSHMNEDHVDAIRHYCDLFQISFREKPEMCAVTGNGMVLRVDQNLHWVEFPQFVATSKEARETLVALARTPLK